MPRRGGGPQHQPVGQLDVLGGLDAAVGVFEPGAGGGEEHGAVRGELGAARDVVGVRVGVGAPRDPPAAFGDEAALPVGQPRRVDHQRGPVTQPDDMR